MLKFPFIRLSDPKKPKGLAESRCRRNYAIIAVLFLLATNSAYLALYFRTPADHVYTGIGHEAVTDKLVYYSQIEQGRAGHVFMINTQTPEPQRPLLFSPHWYLVGQSAEWLHISPQLSYHLYRLLFSLVFIIMLYPLLARLFSNYGQRLMSAAAVFLSSGLGWFYFLLHPEINNPDLHWLQTFNYTPAALYVTEMVTFESFAQSPLFILSYLFIIVIFYFFVRRAREPFRWRTDGLLLLVTILFVLIHPYDAIIMLSVLGSWSVWRLWRTKDWIVFGRLLLLGLAVALAGSYHLWAFWQEPALAGWLKQNITLSPAFGSYAWSFGFLLPLAAIGLYYFWRYRRYDRWWQLIFIWAVMQLILVYLPLATNRRLSNTWFIPVSLAAAYGFFAVMSRLKTYIVQAGIGAVCAMLIFSGTVYQVAQYIWYVPKLDEKYAYYLDPYIWPALTFAHQRLDVSRVLLVNEEYLAALFAGYSQTRLYFGHQHQTVDAYLKNQQREWFFAPPVSPTALKNKADFLRQGGISDILIYKPTMQTDYQWIKELPGVVSVYESPLVEILSTRPLARN